MEFTVTGIIMALIVGLIIGALGRLVVPGRQNIPLWLTMLIGVAAALLGTVIARAFGVAETAGLDWRELFIQVILAALGVALVVGVAGRGRRSSRLLAPRFAAGREEPLLRPSRRRCRPGPRLPWHRDRPNSRGQPRRGSAAR